MTEVKGNYGETLDLDDFEPKHMGYLLDRVTKHMRRDMTELGEALGGIRQFAPLTPSYLRLLSLIPDGGARITDLARLAQMTKQALGQFVDVLEENRYAESSAHPADGRVRLVRRTARGDAAVAVTNEVYRRLHARWRDQVGPARWAAFIEVMTELAIDWDQAPDRDDSESR
jgi:DNA-binding MarR family transcriptional regulator